MSPYFFIALVGSVVVLCNAVFASVSTYRAAPVFLLPLMWAPYWLRRTLDLRPIHYAMFVAAILLHDLGAYGFYQQWPLPFSFDIGVHSFFAFAGFFGIHRALAKHFNFKPWQTDVATLMFIMGCGALHEIMEYMTYLISPEKGMLKPQTSYVFDTARDLTSNLCGTIVALIVIVTVRLLTISQNGSRRARRPVHPEAATTEPRGSNGKRNS